VSQVRSNKVKEEKLEHAEALKTENLHDKLYVDKYIQRRIIFKQQVSYTKFRKFVLCGGVEEGVIGSATDNQKYQCCISKSIRYTNANVTIIIITLYKNIQTS
jgi:hypothetical protein